MISGPFTGGNFIAIPGGVIVLMLIACFLGPSILSLPAPIGGDILESNQPPFSPGHILGTDAEEETAEAILAHLERNTIEQAAPRAARGRS